MAGDRIRQIDLRSEMALHYVDGFTFRVDAMPASWRSTFAGSWVRLIGLIPGMGALKTEQYSSFQLPVINSVYICSCCDSG